MEANGSQKISSQKMRKGSTEANKDQLFDKNSNAEAWNRSVVGSPPTEIA